MFLLLIKRHSEETINKAIFNQKETFQCVRMNWNDILCSAEEQILQKEAQKFEKADELKKWSESMNISMHPVIQDLVRR